MAWNVTESGLALIGDQELAKVFDELVPALQNQVVRTGFKKAGQIILNEAKANFRNRFKVKTNINQYFINAPMKTRVGEKVGVGGDKGYIFRFLEYGTKERFYESKKNHIKHLTGKLKASNFFVDAVEAKKDELVEPTNRQHFLINTLRSKHNCEVFVVGGIQSLKQLSTWLEARFRENAR